MSIRYLIDYLLLTVCSVIDDAVCHLTPNPSRSFSDRTFIYSHGELAGVDVGGRENINA
jgi:hypothetical protein